ncbi:peptidase domain-containing ABC transporter [[Phormidium] sp. ETS-05]|uniref:peptidase domain-containing ABC transporter n=1 Tax=[Phormidium] sp. ETS-05 TaxID=222819 RepID=UPI0031FE5B2E
MLTRASVSGGSRTEFLDRWTGYALLLDPTERLKNLKENSKTSLLSFLKVLWPYRNTGVQIVVASLLIQLFGVVTPMFTQIILDQVVVQGSLSLLNVFALGVFIFGVGGIIIGAIRQYLLDYFSNQVDLTLIAGFISHALQLPLKFFESRRVGDIITRVQENQKIQRFLIRQVVLAWLDFLMGFVYLALMLYYNWSLTLLVLAMIPPIAILTLVATPFLRKVSREVFNAAAEQNSSLVEMMTGVATVKAAAAERDLRWRWEDHLTTSLNARFRGQKLGNLLQVIGGTINSIGSTLLLWYGASLVINGQLSIGQFVAFNMMIGRVMSPFLALVNLWDELQEVWISVERLNDVFAAEPEEVPGQAMLVLPRLRGEVRFDNVTFRYGEDEERNTLQNVSFAVAAGQTVAIVGRSGSGKTTLVKLLQGLYHATNGRILIDGHDVRHISPQSLRSQLGVVPQECFLFSGTILENITLYDEEVSLEEAVEVAQLAEAHAFIQDMPLGYNTQVGERGASLSGGQRQRIAIARALLGEPRILILDEATSSLDTESERRFQQNLTRISRDRTTFIIAHRLSTVRNADCILVLDRGLLVEQGTHPQLMEQRGLYYHLAQQQLDL